MTDLLLSLLLLLTPAVKAEITAYSYSGSLTASGTVPQPGRTLACPRRFNVGTVIWIPGVGLTRCEDRGGLIRGNVFDLFLASHDEAIRWGRRDLIVLVIG